LASLPHDQHTLEFQALLTRWRCTTHPGQSCYKQSENTEPSDHVNLDPKALSDWATAIINKAPFVDLNSPPSTGKEWERILKPKARGNSSSLDTLQRFGQPTIHNHIYMTSRSPHYSPRRHASLPHHETLFSPPTRTPTRRCFETQSSPIVLDHESWAEFDGDGLRAFFTHCERKFKVGSGTGFQEAYLKLRDHEIQPDVMRGKTVEWYEAKGIKSGIAERIVGTFGRWYARLMQDTF